MAEYLDLLRDSWSLFHTFELPVLGMWSYLFIAVLVATEGPLTTLLGAAAAAAGYLDIRLVFAAAVLGNIAGDCLWYALGYYSKDGITWLLIRCPGMTGSHLARLDEKMRSHATKAIALSKITFGLIIPTLVAAGRARVRIRTWLHVVFVVELLWTLLIVTLGYFGAGAVARIGTGLRLFGVASALILMAAVLWFVLRRLKHEDATEGLAVAQRAIPSALQAPQVTLRQRAVKGAMLKSGLAGTPFRPSVRLSTLRMSRPRRTGLAYRRQCFSPMADAFMAEIE